MKPLSLKDFHSIESEQELLNYVLEFEAYFWELSEKQSTESFFISILKEKPHLFRFIDNEYKSEKICLLGVENSGINLKYIPHENQTLTICIKALLNNYNAFIFIRPDLQQEIKYLLNKAIN